MRPHHRFNRDFLRNANSPKSWAVPFGAIATVILVSICTSAAPAQTGFGVQRLSNVPRSSLSTAVSPSFLQNPAMSAHSKQPATPTVPSASVATPGARVANNASSPSQEKEPQPIASVVRLIAFEKNGQSFGSGSYIAHSGRYGLVLSNWHIVKDGDGLVHIHFPNGFSTFGAVIDSDEKWDLATIVISKPPESVVPLAIAQTAPHIGEPLWIAGHGSGAYRLAGGRCVRYLAPEIPKDGSNPTYEILELSVSARQGDSGGPILNHKGELAGVLFGSDMVRNTAGSYCGRVSHFLLRATPILNSLPSQPEVYFASIEKDGPRRQLHETVNFVPAEALASVAAPPVVDIAGSSSSSFGVRPNSRRYVQSGASADKMPSPPPPNPTGGLPSVPPAPAVSPPPPSASSPTAPVQKAVWTMGGTVPRTSTASDGPVVQTGLSTEVVAPLTIPVDPFADDRSALNPVSEPESSHRVIRERLRRADHSEKYAVASQTPHTLASAQSDSRSVSGFTPFLLHGIFFLAGFLVVFAIRLIRSDSEIAEDEAEEIPLRQQRRRAA